MKFLSLFFLLLLGVGCSSPKEKYEDNKQAAKEEYDESMKEAEEEYKEDNKDEAKDVIDDADSVKMNDDEDKIKVED